jgi:hypothetical protein
MSTAVTGPGVEFACALVANDYERVRDLLAPEVEFLGLMRDRSWEASNRDDVIDVLRGWKEDATAEELEEVVTGAVADGWRVDYRWHGEDKGGPFTLEQQAYLQETGGRIGRLRIVSKKTTPNHELATHAHP